MQLALNSKQNLIGFDLSSHFTQGTRDFATLSREITDAKNYSSFSPFERFYLFLLGKLKSHMSLPFLDREYLSNPLLSSNLHGLIMLDEIINFTNRESLKYVTHLDIDLEAFFRDHLIPKLRLYHPYPSLRSCFKKGNGSEFDNIEVLILLSIITLTIYGKQYLLPIIRSDLNDSILGSYLGHGKPIGSALAYDDRAQERFIASLSLDALTYKPYICS